MESTSHPASTAITIPLHGANAASPRQLNKQCSTRRADQNYRPAKVERMDSDFGNASGSSLGSDWASSPIAASHSAEHSRLRLQVSIASPSTMGNATLNANTPSTRHQRKDKQRANSDDLPPNALPPLFPLTQSPLGPSMLSSSSYKSVNLNSHHDPDSKEPARLITYTKHSQGFTWNDELFLPSYLLGRHRHRSHGGSAYRRRWGDQDEDEDIGFDEEGERCPVTDIFVTDEEAAAMMP